MQDGGCVNAVSQKVLVQPLFVKLVNPKELFEKVVGLI